MNWLSNLRFHSICFHSIKKSHFKNNATYLCILLLLGGDIELNPGPTQLNYTLAHPNLCGYYRTAVYFVFTGTKLIPTKDKQGNVLDEHVTLNEGIADMKNIFRENYDVHELDFEKLKKNIKRFLDLNTKWGKNRSRVDKNQYYEHFSPGNWQKLDDVTKIKHTISCEECNISSHEIQAKFPSTARAFTTDRNKNSEHVDTDLEKSKNQGSEKCKELTNDLHNFLDDSLTKLVDGDHIKTPKNCRGACKDLTNDIGKVMDDSFIKHFNMSIQETFQKCNQLEKKKSSEEKRNDKSSVYREAIKAIKVDNDSNAVDRLYGAKQSLRGWDSDRKKKSFETVPNARKRSSKEKIKVECGIKKAKDHVGDFSTYNIDTSLIENLASSWTNETIVVWKKIGEECIQDKENKVPANSGQIAKKYLFHRETHDGFKFTYKGKNEPKKETVRRCLKRIYPKVSIPADMSAKKVKLCLDEKVQSGEIEIGVNIVQREYQKLTLNKFGDVVTQTFSVHGRKHPLSKLREKLFKKYNKFMRLNSDAYFVNLTREELFKRLSSIGELDPNENVDDLKQKLKKYERTRNLQMWHDASVIANHGHILFCVNILYDPAVFYTSDEYKEITGKDINVQREVETPELYIIGRCKSNDEQLGYIETRVECLKELKNGLNLNEIDDTFENIVLNDTMRLFHGDGPAVALEAGNQKGGYYFCPCCDVHLCQTDDISCCYQQKIMSLQDKQSKVIKGKFGRKNTLKKETCPFEKLSAVELKEELQSRNINLEHLKITKKDLVPMLKKELRGVKRIPILLFNDPLIDLKMLGLSKYEFAMVECMHDIAGHIDNILEELPNHLKGDDKNKINEMLKVYYAGKDKKRCCDRRKILLQLTQNLYHKIDGKAHKVIKTLSEIQRILYLGDDLRTPKQILRLHNSCFEHFVLLKDVIPIKNLSEKMTRDRFYGKYKHNLLVHAPIQYRLVSGESINCEDEERFFKSIRDITRATTNNRPGHLIGNLIVRQEVESVCKENYEFDKTKDYTIRELNAVGIKLQEIQYNSLFTYNYIQNNSADWQSHLQRISDYLFFGENVWWKKTEFGIEFFDVVNIPEKLDLNPKVHHFRSANINTVTKELEEHWTSILENNICIPTHEILIGNEDEIVQYRKTTFLSNRVEFDNSLPNSKSSITTTPVNIIEEELEEDLTDFTIRELDNNTITTNVDYDQISSTGHCANYGSSGSSSNYISNEAIKSNKHNSTNTNSLSSKEASAIYLVLREMSPFLEKYDRKKSAFKIFKTKQMYKGSSMISNDYSSNLLDMQSTLQTQVLKKISTLKRDFEKWERSFLIKNDMCAPRNCDIEDNSSIVDISRRINIANQLLRNWEIVF